MSPSRSIFINYRRSISKEFAEFIYDSLSKHFGQEAVFMDVDSIPRGIDFVEYLDDQVLQCQVFIALIGPGWVDSRDEEGNRRLENEEDFVRVEIESALDRNIPVIPLLHSNAEMPSKRVLPENLKKLVRRNGLEVRPGEFKRAMEVLISDIEQIFDRTNTKTPTTKTTFANTPTQTTKPAVKPGPSSLPTKEESDEFANLPSRYKTLKKHLANRRWKEADEETRKVMLEVARRTEQGWLGRRAIEQFPCEDLRTIDRLWVKFSDGHFGFSVQKKIYVEVGNPLDGKYHEEEHNNFANRVGWLVSGSCINYSEGIFESSAPRGHLPLFVGVLVVRRMRRRGDVGILLSRPDL